MKKTDENLRRIVKRNLRLFRKEKGYTQEEVAAALGMVRSTYTYYETGKTCPNIYALHKLAQLYHIDCGLFFMEEPDTRPSPQKHKKSEGS